MKNILWNNDVDEEFDAIAKAPGEFGLDYDASSDEILEEACKQVRKSFEKIREKLSDELAGEIFVVGNIVRWDGPRQVYKPLKVNNIGDALVKAMSCYGGDNTFEIYTDKNGLYLSQLGHDNPVNPSIMEFRMLKSSDDMEDWLCSHNDGPENLKRNSVSLGKKASAMYA